jgi:hypothetical protein
MVKITPLDRIRKVYKDKTKSYEKSSYAYYLKLRASDEENDKKLVDLSETPEVTAAELKAKRDIKYKTAFMQTLTGSVTKILSQHQYRIHLSSNKNSMEVDNQ